MTPDFRYYLRVRYGECDAQKVVFNARYGDYVDLAVTEFLRALGYGDGLVSGEFDFQLVKQTTEWKAPARFDDVLEISVRCVRIGNTSFALAATLRRAGEEQAIVTCETIYVMVDHALAKIPVADDVRACLERGAPGVIVDHAGWTARA